MEYTIRLIAQHLKKNPTCEGYPAVIPLVCFAGEDPYNGPKSISEAFQDPEMFIQTLRSTFLTNINTEEEKETLKDKSAALASMLLKHAKIRDFCQLFENKTFIRLLQTSPYQTEALVYIVSQDQHKPDQVLEKIAILGEDKKHKIMSYVLRQMKQVRSEGIQQGRYEGAKTEQFKIAKQMLVKGMDIKLVAELTGLSEAEIKNQT